MKKILKWIGIVFLFFIIIGLFSGGKSKKDNLSPTITSIPKQNETTVTPTQEPKKDLFKVVKVIDGDTIQININGKIEAVRLIGVDSPETVDPRKSVQCFGLEASNKAKEILTGKNVFLESDITQGERDKYSRLLRYVFLDDGRNFNLLMISEGFAHEYTYAIPYKYQVEFKEAQRQASINKKGLWADNICNSITPTKTSTPIPIATVQQSQVVPTSISTSAVSGYSCSGKSKCGEMKTCEEAYFYMNNCGVGSLDGDKDGVPCESICR